MLYYKKIELDESKDWVVFIHGAGGSSAIWYKQIKYFQEHFNLLFIDLRGHGKSIDIKQDPAYNEYSFEGIAKDVLEVLDFVEIPKAHFIGVSLGTIIIRQLAEIDPSRLKSMVLAGAITHLNFKSRFWVGLGRLFKNVMPYMWLYRLFAFVIMPAKGHEESRNVFIREAQKLCQREFLRWFKLTGQLTGLLRKLDTRENLIPTLYVMGEQDHLFLNPIRKMIDNVKNSTLLVVEECGHVVNIEQARIFNEWAVKFLNSQIEVNRRVSYVKRFSGTN